MNHLRTVWRSPPRYSSAGQRYMCHHDTADDADLPRRVATVLIYLTDVSEGGETVLPRVVPNAPAITLMGQNYMGHNYTGRDYMGHDCMGHDFMGHTYMGDDFYWP